MPQVRVVCVSRVLVQSLNYNFFKFTHMLQLYSDNIYSLTKYFQKLALLYAFTNIYDIYLSDLLKCHIHVQVVNRNVHKMWEVGAVIEFLYSKISNLINGGLKSHWTHTLSISIEDSYTYIVISKIRSIIIQLNTQRRLQTRCFNYWKLPT